MSKLNYEDFDQECTALAKYLIGKVLARKLESGHVLRGIIVETEAYLGGEDKASHSFGGKVTERCKPMYAASGTSYVYSIYGMYHCINISSQGPGAAVLLRALEPIENIDQMQLFRNQFKKKNKETQLKKVDLCNGPSKLCIALNITKELNNEYMPDSDVMWIEDVTPSDVDEPIEIISCSRIGIEKCGVEWASKKLRYYMFKNVFVSKRDKKCEKEHESTY